MIRVDVEGYCHQCLDFHPDVTPPVKTFSSASDEPIMTDTVIKCEYRRRCSGIKRYLEQQTKTEGSK